MNCLFIVNPEAGRSRGARSLSASIKRGMAQAGWRYDLIETGHLEDASRLAAEAAASGTEVVVAVGGDGTVREVASALVETRSCLGIVPSGSGNAVARELAIPLKLDAACRMLPLAVRARLDMGLVNGKRFLMAAGLGADARVARAFAGRRGLERGALTYFLMGAREAWCSRPIKARIRKGADSTEISALLVVAANISRYGYNARIAPGATYDDGLLDVVIIDPIPRALLLLYAYRLFAGTLDRSARVRRFKAASLEIDGQSSFELHLDGDPYTLPAPLRLSVIKGAVTVLVPGQRSTRPVRQSNWRRTGVR